MGVNMLGILVYIGAICIAVALVVVRLYLLMTAAQLYLEEKTKALRRKDDN